MTTRKLVGLMCNFSVAMPDNFTLMFQLEEVHEQDLLKHSDHDSGLTEAPQVPPSELTYAEGNCSEKIYANTTPAPTTPSKPAVEGTE
uniref:Putative anticomplement protein ixac-b2 n=1 Tax=Ixodes ricinus TaxID=34613 RepID=V5H2Z8_IXORI